jgi:hypothetical protein
MKLFGLLPKEKVLLYPTYVLLINQGTELMEIAALVWFQ